MAMTAGKTWTMTAWTGYYPGYGEMHVTWSFQQFYDVIGNYSQIYLTDVQCYHSSGSQAEVWVTSVLSHFGGGFVTSGNLGGASISQGNRFPVVGSQKIYHDESGNGAVTMTADGRVSCGDLQFASELRETSVTVDLFIPRASALSAADGTLGVEQTLTVTRKHPAYTHTVTYTCGEVSGTLCTQSGETSLRFTPPVELAVQNTTGTDVPVSFTIRTYTGDTPLGQPETITVAMAIPETVKPVAAEGWVSVVPENVGAVAGLTCYVQGYSRAVVSFDTTKVTMAYGGEVARCTVQWESELLMQAPYCISVFPMAGEAALHCTLTDTRGRSVTETLSVPVQPYAKPVLSDIQVYRSNRLGVASDTGLYIAVQAAAGISGLCGENTGTLQVRYKTGTGAYGEYQTISAGQLHVVGDGNISTTNSYVVQLLLTDRLGNTAVFSKIIPTESVFFSGREGGRGAGFGKHPESDDVLDIDWNLRTRKSAAVEGNLTVSGDAAVEGDVTAHGDAVLYGDMTVSGVFSADTANLSALTVGGKSMLDYVYPVGSVYISVSSASPALLFGGTWTRLQDKFLLAAGEEFEAGTEGGTPSHVLVNENLPAQSMRFAYLGNIGDSNSWSCGQWGSHGDGYCAIPLEQYPAYFGHSRAVDHMPPYLAVYIWQRLE